MSGLATATDHAQAGKPGTQKRHRGWLRRAHHRGGEIVGDGHGWVGMSDQ